MIERIFNLGKKYGLRMLVVLLSMLFLCTYISRKEGYHMDEILAYQLANAEYNPWILPTEPERRLARFMEEYVEGETLGETLSNVSFLIKDTLQNRGSGILASYKAQVYEAPVWISGEMFQDYLQCDKDDDYNLLSAYYNAIDDNHPPLYFMVLHLMSSLFKGEISAWVGCFINLVAVAGVLWLLGLIGDMIFKRKASVLALMILYGFSMGAVGTAIWVRMYGLLTLWTVWIMYLHLRKYAGRRAVYAEQRDAAAQEDNILVSRGSEAEKKWDSFARRNVRTGKIKWIGSVGILILTVLSFWTQYFGLFFILPLAAVTVILLAKDKRLQEMWAYIRTMVTAAVIGICGFPFAISDVLFSSRGTEALGQWESGLGTFLKRLVAFGEILGENVTGSGLFLVLALLVPGVCLLLIRRQEKNAWWPFVMCGIPALVYFMLAAKMSPYFVDRYIMAIFPITALVIVWLWDCAMTYKQQSIDICQENITAGVKKCKHAMTLRDCAVVGVAVFLVIFQNIHLGGQHQYLYTGYKAQLAVADTYTQYPCVCLYPGLSFYENIMEMERYSQTMLVKSEELAAMDEARTMITEEGYIALIKYPGEENGKEQLSQVMEVFGGNRATLLYRGEPYGDVIYLVEP